MNKKYKIIADENMPGIDRLFSDIADITYANGRDITNKMLLDADALLCRSITNVNAALLKDSQVQFVGTATIGIDHLDVEWLNRQAVAWSNAAGCNAPAVGQYVLSGISYWCLKNKRSIRDLTVGIVGAGNVGTILASYLDFYGIKYKLCDPPLQDKGDSRQLTDIQSILKCDVITLHVPITKEGKYPTYHLISKSRMEKLNDRQLLINASRGAVVNNHDLERYLKNTHSASCILDVFENEPNINVSVVKNCLLATPHIAGHTLEGKLRGSWMIYEAFCSKFNEYLKISEEDLYPISNKIEFSTSLLEDYLLKIFDISFNSDSLKSLSSKELSSQFDRLRKDATKLSSGTFRRDYSGWQNINLNPLFNLPENKLKKTS